MTVDPVIDEKAQNLKKMSKIRTYVQETSNELLHKVTWPTWSELQGSAVVVMVASVIIGVLVWAMDLGFSKLMEAAYQMVGGI